MHEYEFDFNLISKKKKKGFLREIITYQKVSHEFSFGITDCEPKRKFIH